MQNERQETQIQPVMFHTSTGEKVRRRNAKGNSKLLKATVFKILGHMSVECMNQKSFCMKY